jgi:hypothetical protein
MPPTTTREGFQMNRNYKLKINFADGQIAKMRLATYGLLVSLLVGLKVRNDQAFTFTVSIFGRELDTEEYRQLFSAVDLWIDVHNAKAVEAHTQEATGRLYHFPMTAREAEEISF